MKLPRPVRAAQGALATLLRAILMVPALLLWALTFLALCAAHLWRRLTRR